MKQHSMSHVLPSAGPAYHLLQQFLVDRNRNGHILTGLCDPNHKDE